MRCGNGDLCNTGENNFISHIIVCSSVFFSLQRVAFRQRLEDETIRALAKTPGRRGQRRRKGGRKRRRRRGAPRRRGEARQQATDSGIQTNLWG